MRKQKVKIINAYIHAYISPVCSSTTMASFVRAWQPPSINTNASVMRRGGYGVVIREASQYPASFLGFLPSDIEDVEELPIGTQVLVLPQYDNDMGWAPIIVSDDKARFTWHHPECIRLFHDCELGGTVAVGHTKRRGSRQPTHVLPNSDTGVKRIDNTLVLDARWERPSGPWRPSLDCSGWCTCWCVHTASSQDRVTDLMEFAAYREKGYVVCSRGKHRSLSAACILDLFFARSVNYGHAYRQRQCQCEMPATSNLDCINDAFRSLPRQTQTERLLSNRLGLPKLRLSDPEAMFSVNAQHAVERPSHPIQRS